MDNLVYVRVRPFILCRREGERKESRTFNFSTNPGLDSGDLFRRERTFYQCPVPWTNVPRGQSVNNCVRPDTRRPPPPPLRRVRDTLVPLHPVSTSLKDLHHRRTDQDFRFILDRTFALHVHLYLVPNSSSTRLCLPPLPLCTSGSVRPDSGWSLVSE